MNVDVGNASLVECICECCKANCVTTNETVCSDSLYMFCLMWPHDSLVWHNGGRLVAAACANSEEQSSVRRYNRLCRHHVVAQAFRSHRVVVVRIAGRVVASIASLWSWSNASRNRVVMYVS